jgi:hypothetical protein
VAVTLPAYPPRRVHRLGTAFPLPCLRGIMPNLHDPGKLLMPDRDDVRIRVLRKDEDGERRDVADLEPAERLAMMWQLALDAWAFKGEGAHAESRLQRHVVRVYRRRR